MLCPIVFRVVKPPVDTAAVSSKTLVLLFGIYCLLRLLYLWILCFIVVSIHDYVGWLDIYKSPSYQS